MNVNFRFPRINGKTEAQQIAQIRSFLHQLVEQLNWAMQDTEKTGDQTAVPVADGTGASKSEAGESAANAKRFAQLQRQIDALGQTVETMQDSLQQQINDLRYEVESMKGTGG